MRWQALRPIARLGGVAAACVVVSTNPLLAQATAAQSRRPKPPSRIERLEAWLVASEGHEPGRADEPTRLFDSWRVDDFEWLQVDINVVLLLMDDPKLETFFEKAEGRRPQRQVFFSGFELKQLRTFAKAAAARGGDDTSVSVEERLVRNRNHLLKRGAILHTDVAILEQISGRIRPSRPDSGAREVTLYLPDGRQTGLGDDVGHREIARTMLDKIAPEPARDEMVRRWYIVTAAYWQGVFQLMPSHFTHALRLFPNDPDVLFLAGCLHESLAQPRIQEVMQTAAIPTGLTFDISSTRAELRDAEGLFRQALKARPDFVEARIHLGRVLGRRGQHAEAATLLRKAASTAKDRLLQYYAELFLGGEVEALGDRDEARVSYARAAALFPRAQSPQLALSLLSARDGNHAAAVGTIAPVLALPADTGERNDPWWTYHVSPGRTAQADLDDLYSRFLAEDRQ